MNNFAALATFLILNLVLSQSYAANSYRINNGVTNRYIWEHAVCGKISNSSGRDYFVPTKTLTEWNAFLAAVNSGVTKVICDPVPDAVNWANGSGEYCSETAAIAMTGIDMPIDIGVEGFEEDYVGDGLGFFQYSLNGGAYVDAYHDIDSISWPMTQSVSESIPVVNGDTLKFRYCVTMTGANTGSMDFTIYNGFTGTVLDTVTMGASLP